MLNFVPLQDVKTYLGIMDDTNDEQLQKILEAKMNIIEKRVWNLVHWERTETHKKYTNSFNNNLIPCGFYNATKLLEIDGFPVEESDYTILNNWAIQVLNLKSKIKSNFDYYKVKYEAGIEAGIEGDDNSELLEIVAQLVGLEFSKDMGREVANEQMGPRSVSFETSGSKGKAWFDSSDKVLAKLNKFIPAHLKAYRI